VISNGIKSCNKTSFYEPFYYKPFYVFDQMSNREINTYLYMGMSFGFLLNHNSKSTAPILLYEHFLERSWSVDGSKGGLSP
jgi:hypothetical protein